MAWEKYGFGFWAGFIALSLVMGVCGACAAVYGGWHLVSDGFALSPALLLVTGLMAVIAAIFCAKLLPRWAEMVREARMGNERLRGILGSASVSQYIQADENRNRILMENIERKQNDVGITLSKKIERSDLKTSAILENLQRSLAAMTSKLAAMADPAELERYRREAERLEKENRKLRGERGASASPVPAEDEGAGTDSEDEDLPVRDEDEDSEPLGYVSPEDEAAAYDGGDDEPEYEEVDSISLESRQNDETGSYW